MASIYTPDGELITNATLELPENGSVARLRSLPRSNGLLHYYFGRGGRRVIVETEDGRFEAHLHTRWERAARAWEVVMLGHSLVAPAATETAVPATGEEERAPGTPAPAA